MLSILSKRIESSSWEEVTLFTKRTEDMQKPISKLSARSQLGGSENPTMAGWKLNCSFSLYIWMIITFKDQWSVILFVVGHKSHMSYHISELCTELGIILTAQYPNATRILQPADVNAFKPLKTCSLRVSAAGCFTLLWNFKFIH